ncbi:hypothetical protein N7488_002221 [Penicillium malachiteum]|nr:hypothetical protein N7488_002221 [Penicillium malachiteum]
MDPIVIRPDADGIKLRTQIEGLVDRCLARFDTGSHENRIAMAKTLLFFNVFGRDICAHAITILRERALIHKNEDVCLGYDAAMPHIETNTTLDRPGLTIDMVFEDFMRMYKQSGNEHTQLGVDNLPRHLAESVCIYRPREANWYFASQILPDEGIEATSSPLTVEVTGAAKFKDPNERAKHDRYIAPAKPFDEEKLRNSRRRMARALISSKGPWECGNCRKALKGDEELVQTRCMHWYCVDCSTICMMRSADCDLCAWKNNPKWWTFASASASSGNHSGRPGLLELEGGGVVSRMINGRMGRLSSRL